MNGETWCMQVDQRCGDGGSGQDLDPGWNGWPKGCQVATGQQVALGKDRWRNKG